MWKFVTFVARALCSCAILPLYGLPMAVLSRILQPWQVQPGQRQRPHFEEHQDSPVHLPRVPEGSRVQGAGFAKSQGQGSGFRAQGYRVQGSGFRAQGSGFRAQGSGFGVQG